MEAAVAVRIDRQPDPKPFRSEAIRRLIEKELESNGRTSVFESGRSQDQ